MNALKREVQPPVMLVRLGADEQHFSFLGGYLY